MNKTRLSAKIKHKKRTKQLQELKNTNGKMHKHVEIKHIMSCQRIKEENTWEIRKYLETNEMNTICQNLYAAQCA